MSVSSKMAAIADAIREKTGGTDALTLDGMAAAIAGIEAGGGGGSMKTGVITPAESTQTLTIEHGYGSDDYNFFAITAIDRVGSYSKAVSSATAYRFNSSQSYASLLFEYGGSSKGYVADLKGAAFGHLHDDSVIKPNELVLSTALGVYPLNSSYADVVFKAGVSYFWIVGKV